jgi:hypothetical protein
VWLYGRVMEVGSFRVPRVEEHFRNDDEVVVPEPGANGEEPLRRLSSSHALRDTPHVPGRLGPARGVTLPESFYARVSQSWDKVLYRFFYLLGLWRVRHNSTLRR